MKLINADDLIVYVKSTGLGAGTDTSQKDIVEAIENCPVAYDADKVVEQLKTLKMQYFLTIANTGDVDKECAYKNIANTIDKAIEIVKGGGIE